MGFNSRKSVGGGVIAIIALALLLFKPSNSVDTIYLIRTQDNDYGDRLFEHVNLDETYVIWNYHWQPNMWYLAKQLLEKQSNYVLKTPQNALDKDRAAMMEELRQAKWVIDSTDNVRFARSLDPVRDKWLLDKLAIVIFEPAAVDPGCWDPDLHNRVARILMWDDSYAKKYPEKYFLMRFPFYSGAKMIDPVVPFDQKKLCCFLNANKGWGFPNSVYEKRREDMEFWDSHYPNDFEFYGGEWPQGRYATYKGIWDAADKVNCLKNYRFSLAYENMNNVHGWVAEKIFHCFEAGCVPVYIGPINIDQFVPQNCYVDRNKFDNNEQLYAFLKNMSESEYEVYLKNIRNYLNSDMPREFTRERFAEYVVAGILNF